MDKSDDQLTEQFLARALETTGFNSVSKNALQKLSWIPSAKMRILAKRVHQTMNQSKHHVMTYHCLKCLYTRSVDVYCITRTLALIFRFLSFILCLVVSLMLVLLFIFIFFVLVLIWPLPGVYNNFHLTLSSLDHML